MSCNFSFDRQCPVTKEPNSHIQTHPALGCGTRPLHLSLPHSQVTISPVQPAPGAVWPHLCGQGSMPRTHDADPLTPARGTARGPASLGTPCVPLPSVPLSWAQPSLLLEVCAVLCSPLPGLQQRDGVPAGITEPSVTAGQGLAVRSCLLPFPRRQREAGGCVSSRQGLKRLTGPAHLRQGLFWALSCR